MAKTTKNKSISTKKTPKTKKTEAKQENSKVVTFKRKINPKVTKALIFIFGVLCIFSTYAWFSMNLNVQVKIVKLSVKKNSDFEISLDGINYGYTIDITEDVLLDELYDTYPTHNSQWNGNGFIPVSSPGITNPNNSQLTFFESTGVLYKKRQSDDGFLYTTLVDESEVREYNSYVAFDIYIRNNTGSPVSDNLFISGETSVTPLDENISEEMQGLVNSFRIGIVKIGETALTTPVEDVQSMTCNNACQAVIYEPNSTEHTDLAIERAKKVGVNLVNGTKFPTYAFNKEGGPLYLKNIVSGSNNMETEYLQLQETLTDDDLNQPIFTIPSGITKARIYIWIEGQDIDSLETDSEGTDVDVIVSFYKDTQGYDSFDN